ncbi:glycosyltransferase family 4 protein [Hufsiella ginkgonis]|uniref:Glycosyltransferase n=1 Tax=Hufsiella ginkgonis TaxID=2695274 RepID=A0A7K1Y270_9SPHI|nr:glycosyltransferase family 4 protein [Hufsiella ginkgonis]MXV17109.1 glycosyltransferase [Hufsiella ginkgonis]
MSGVQKILFLTLRTFSVTGGIEKMCRSMAKALYDLEVDGKIRMRMYSAYDRSSQLDLRYLPPSHFTAFAGRRGLFAWRSFLAGLDSDMIILSHIHLLPVIRLVHIFSSQKRVAVFAHGTEVWRAGKAWEKAMLRSRRLKIWSVSHFTAQEVRARQQADERDIFVLNNCLDPFFVPPDDFKKPPALLRKYGLTPGQPVLMTLARLVSPDEQKGYDQVLECLPSLKAKFPGICYLLAGQTAGSERLRLETLINNRGLAGDVRFTGFIPDNLLPDIYQLADIFVMPSRREGFGIVFIEAAACGACIIGGNQDGSADALLNGKLGKMVDPDDIGGMTTAIETMLMSPDPALRRQVQSLCLQSFGFEGYRKQVQLLLGV